MIARPLSIVGLGAATETISSAEALASPHLKDTGGNRPAFSTLDSKGVEGADKLAQWAIRASHQAWHMARLDAFDRDATGLIFVTAWGTIESTLAYLESMLAEGGRFASPRYFSRSVFSSVASTLAIQFGIHGPCETLAFESRHVEGALMRAWRLLAARRCQRVLVVWAEEHAEIAEHLAIQATGKLAKKSYSRYADQGIGEGAVALVVAGERLQEGVLGRIDADCIDPVISRGSSGTASGKPFATDEALLFLRGFLRRPDAVAI